MNEQPHIDYDGLAAFIAGELGDSDRRKWEEWVAASPENEKLYQECLMLFEPEFSESDSAQFDTTAAWEKVSERIAPQVIQMPVEQEESTTIQWWKWAAVFLVGGFLITYLWTSLRSDQLIFTQDSGIASYVLPDSSVVTLKGKARLAVGDGFNEQNRDVQLTGQGYFDVTHNDTLTFNVYTDRTQLSVLGTAFLIEETADSLFVLVERGHVSVGLKEKVERLDLLKNEAGVIWFETETLREREAESLNALYWANSTLSYRRSSLVDVLDELASVFDKEIIYDEEVLSDCRITAIFRDQSFQEIMENIELSFPLRYTVNGRRVEIESNGCSN